MLSNKMYHGKVSSMRVARPSARTLVFWRFRILGEGGGVGGGGGGGQGLEYWGGGARGVQIPNRHMTS